MSKSKTIFIFIPFFVLSALVFTACGKEERKPSLPVMPAKVEVLSADDKPVYVISEIGTVKPVKEVELISKTSGTLSRLNAGLGDSVPAGQELMVIDEAADDNSAKVNLNNAKLQLANAQKAFDDVRENNESMVYQSENQVKNLETTLDTLKRNLADLKTTNESTLKTMELTVSTAQKNADNAGLADSGSSDQFDQSYSDFYENTETSLNAFFGSAESFYESATSILNPRRLNTLYVTDVYRLIGARDQKQLNKTVNLYNGIDDLIASTRAAYDDAFPLNAENTEQVLADVSLLAEKVRMLAEAMRLTLDASSTDSDCTAAALNSYRSIISASEAVALQNVSMINQLKQGYSSLILSSETQTGMSANNLTIAENQLAEAKNAFERFKLTSASAVKDLQAQTDQLSRDLSSAKSALMSAKRNRDMQNNAKELEVNLLKNQFVLAEKSFGDTKITSPISGAVSELTVDEGDYISPGMKLGKVIDYKQVKVVFYVSEDIAAHLSVNHPVSFRISGNGGKIYGGVISHIAPMADSLNKKIRIEAFTANRDFALKPEMPVDVSVDITKSVFADKDIIYVPLNAVIIEQDQQYVFVAKEQAAHKIPVTAGQIYGDWVVVNSGLSKKDQVIVEGQRNLEEGDAITMTNDK